MRFSRFDIDGTTLALLAMLFVVPLLESLSEIRIPGFFEAKIGSREVQEAVDKAPIEPTQNALGDNRHWKDLAELAQNDPQLALARWRIELERLLSSLYRLAVADQQKRRLGARALLEELFARSEISGQVYKAANDILPLANRAVHGERITSDDAEKLVTLGIAVLEELRAAFDMRTTKPDQTRVISKKELDQFLSSRYRVTTVIPYTEHPRLNVRVLPQEGLDALLEGYEEYAEFVVGVERLDQ